MIRQRRYSDNSGWRIAALIAGAIALMYFARGIFIPLAFALVIALMLSPAVAWLQKVRVRRVVAVMAVMLISVTGTATVGYVIFDQLVKVVNELPAYRTTIRHKIESFNGPHSGSLGKAAQSVKELQKELTHAPGPSEPGAGGKGLTPPPPVPVQVAEVPSNALSYLRDVTAPVLGPLATLGMVLVFTVFLMIEQEDLQNRLIRLAGLSRINVLTQALNDATRRVSRYLFLQLVVNLAFGLICGAGLYLIGVPYAALWGTLVALLRIVPYVGALAAMLPPLLLSLAVFDSLTPPLLVFLLFSVLELLTGNFIEPLLYGAHTGISSLALLVTTIFWATLWGPAGLILSTPLTVCVVVLGRYVSTFSFLHTLLGDQSVVAPEAQLYQRLLAMDDAEARAVADKCRSEMSALEFYDAVVLPALVLAEQDRHKGALDPERSEFITLFIKELVTEFGEVSFAAGRAAAPRTAGIVQPRRILCLSANDEADETATAMLAQLLDHRACVALAFPPNSSVETLLGVVDPAAAETFFISAVPPLALTNAKIIGEKIRAAFPEARICVGIWGFSGDKMRAAQRLRLSQTDGFAVTLAEALDLIQGPTEDTENSTAESPATDTGPEHLLVNSPV